MKSFPLPLAVVFSCLVPLRGPTLAQVPAAKLRMNPMRSIFSTLALLILVTLTGGLAPACAEHDGKVIAPFTEENRPAPNPDSETGLPRIAA